jgi:hypothetical protein
MAELDHNSKETYHKISGGNMSIDLNHLRKFEIGSRIAILRNGERLGEGIVDATQLQGGFFSVTLKDIPFFSNRNVEFHYLSQESQWKMFFPALAGSNPYSTSKQAPEFKLEPMNG